MPRKFGLTGIILLLLVCGEFLKHYWGMTMFSMIGYHVFSFVLNAMIALGAIVYVWLAENKHDRAMCVKNQALDHANETLRRLQQTKDQMTAMLVHDIRNALTGVMSGLELIQTHPAISEIDELREYVHIGRDSLTQTINLISNLMDIARMEEAKMELDIADLDFGPLLLDVVEKNRAVAQRKRLKMTVDAPDSLPPVPADRQLIVRVLDNLIANAVQYGPEGTVIHVSAVAQQGQNLLIRVKDNGQGIPREYLDKIFEKYVTIPSNAPHARRSTGLGLTFCKLAIEAHGGRIWVESEASTGSTFTVSLPLKRERGSIDGDEMSGVCPRCRQEKESTQTAKRWWFR